MGSSSTVTVGLLNAMYHYLGQTHNAETLAREACEIEIDILGKPIGIQDQYVASYGGQRFFKFKMDGTVDVENLELSEDLGRRLNQNLMLFFTNITRKSESILAEQVRDMDGHLEILCEMKKLALDGRDCLKLGELDEIGLLLNKGWELKKQLASRISNPIVDGIYNKAILAGALGGKLTGAGGGGFLLLYCRRDKQDAVRSALAQFTELPFHLEKDGTKVIFNYRR
jgi:D-glycero-alpha-D-manno-heptose-7-phosphate kinase